MPSYLFRRKLIWTDDVDRPQPIVGLEWHKIDDTYQRLQSRVPPLAAAVAWDKVADTYSRPERG
ncbi:MAG TPA: hypothetical protein DD420_13595 [Streptomyces sp.]|jgi:hypothetical protein|nr:hypothetical protein [Streptomyces sp.]